MSTIRKNPILRIAPPYDDAQIRYIEKGFSDRLGYGVQFDVREDPSLLCGFIAYIRGTVYDVSGKTQLAGVSAYLIDAMNAPRPAPEPLEQEDA